MQGLLDDTASKPLVMQQTVGAHDIQDLANQLKRALENVPTIQLMELNDKAGVLVASLTSLVSPSLDLLKNAPVMPEGVELNQETGVITAKLETPVSNCTFTVRASNASGECQAVVTLCAAGQIAPAGLSFHDAIPAASEFANPPNSTGVLLVGDGVSMDPTYDHLGLPAGNFSVQPPLPAGLTLNARSGKMAGTPIRDTPRGDYIVTLANPSGKTDITLSLEVQKHVKPSVEFSFPPYLFVGQSITPVEPKIADDGNRLMFSVSPPLPEGLMMDAWSGVVSGTPPDAIGKIECTVTARNRRGEQRTKISFEIHGAPSSITYTGVPGPNEFADPPHATGLLLVDNLVSLKPNSGLPWGTWSVQPALPAGLTLSEQTGHIDGKPTRVMPRSNYTLTLENPSGKANFTLNLEVQ
jgi:hypothetical protein